jgi:uncharacterized membrane protein YuzA (DUF378 family)
MKKHDKLFAGPQRTEIKSDKLEDNMDKAKAMNIVNVTAPVLVSLGALNWGLIGLFKYNVIEEVLGNGGSATDSEPLAKVVYVLIGASAVYTLGLIPVIQKKLKKLE